MNLKNPGNSWIYPASFTTGSYWTTHPGFHWQIKVYRAPLLKLESSWWWLVLGAGYIQRFHINLQAVSTSDPINQPHLQQTPPSDNLPIGSMRLVYIYLYIYIYMSHKNQLNVGKWGDLFKFLVSNLSRRFDENPKLVWVERPKDVVFCECLDLQNKRKH